MIEKGKQSLTAIQEGIREIANSNDLKSIVDEVDEITDKLQSQSFYIVVLGLFKRGKSSIINALLDAEVAPVAITPLTSVVTFFKYAEEKRAEIIFEDGKTKTVELREIDAYVSEDLNPENTKKVREVEVYFPSDILKMLTLVDTPGLGSLYAHNSKTTTSFIPKIDAALYVLSADLPISAADAEFLKNLRETVPKLFFLLNKKDLIDNEGLAKLKAFNLKNIIQLTGVHEQELNFICISAKQFTEAKNKEEKNVSGIPTLSQELSDLTKSKGTELIVKSAANRLEGLIQQTEQLLKLRLAALNAPIKDIEEQTEKLKKSLDLIESNQEDFLSVIKSRNKRIQEDVKSVVNQKT